MRNNYDHIKEESIRLLYDRGLGNREIARQLDIPHHVIGYRLKKYGLISNVARGIPPEYIDKDHSRCAKCQEVTPNKDFPWVQGRADGRRLSYCKKCRSRQMRENLYSSIEKYCNEKQNRIRLRCEKTNTAYDLPEKFLYDLWTKQEGKCFYTDKPMTTIAYRESKTDAPSVDRIAPSGGYTTDNVVFCLNRINTIKHNLTLAELAEWIPSWYARIEAGLLDKLAG